MTILSFKRPVPPTQRNSKIMIELFRTVTSKCSWHRKRGQEKIYHVPHKKLPFLFRPLGLGLHILVQIAILATVASLWALSSIQNGIVSVPSTPSSIFGGGLSDALLWSFSLLWTTVPSILVSLYAILFNALIDRLKSCQVTMELCKPSALDKTCLVCHREHRWACRWNPLPLFFKYHHLYRKKRASRSTPDKTILLDYSSFGYSFPFFNAWRAAKCNRHYIVAACMLVKFAISPISTGFAANVLAVANVPSNTTIPLTLGKDFDAWSLTEKSLRPAFDIVSASVVNGARTIAWTTSTHSFRPLSFLSLDTYDGNWNVTAPATAYSSTLDCNIMDINDIGKQGGLVLDAPVGSPGGSSLNMAFEDRGCFVNSPYVILSNPGNLHMQSWAQTDCSYESGVERFGFFAGIVDASARYGLANFTLVSCIPTFWNSSASVTVTVAERKSYVVSSSISFSKAFTFLSGFSHYLANLTLYTSIDVDEDMRVDQLGRLSYNLVNSLGPNSLKESFKTIYMAVFAAAASLSGYTVSNSTDSETAIPGILSRPTNRLFVVWRPAVIVMTSITAALVCTIWAAFYVHSHKDTLLRGHEPVVLGHAMTLDHAAGPVGDEVAEYISILKSDAVRSIKAEERQKERKHAEETSGTATGKDSGDLVPSEDESINQEEMERLLKNRNIIEYARKKKELSGDNWECWLDERDKIRLNRTGGTLGYLHEEASTGSGA